MMFKRMFCKHEWSIRLIHGDERLVYGLYEHTCKSCGKRKFGNTLLSKPLSSQPQKGE